MENWDFLRSLQADFAFDLTTEEDEAVLTNRDTGGKIGILLETYACPDSPEYLSQFEYEIHSWSGTLDTGRRKVEELP